MRAWLAVLKDEYGVSVSVFFETEQDIQDYLDRLQDPEVPAFMECTHKEPGELRFIPDVGLHFEPDKDGHALCVTVL